MQPMNEIMNEVIQRAISIAGTQDALAKKTGLSQGLISKYKRNACRVNANHALKIEIAVDRQVMRHEMCPEAFQNYVYQPAK